MNTNIFGGRVVVKDVNVFIKELKEIGDPYILQVVDTSYLISIDQIYLAVRKTIESFNMGNNISNDPSIEFLLYLSGKRSIDKAIEMGIKDGENYAVFVICDEDADKLEQDIKERFAIKQIDIEDLIRYDSSKKNKVMDFYNITNEEIDAVGEKKLPRLILEREVLLDLLK
ncbi:MAG: hypothetical protein EF806_01185 [Candidatus Methanoliparum thermophilum]|uniref:Kinase binding protein CGI-121 n=1 Tax=Methanoliparum thermophilum TaxID=2491083 RepID=A0A520KTW9_METT2|nr:KEOPS complex subunit Cgi121 [Candidatus Methanoliparum sp. LAM-1]RZN65533.1 MAG: hypothetical protein EF806_01185 [Candidatus Methanoliparum thermophilum]BDC35371.1 hypothetical protein MTLP_00530 [Candidatus Methanoliparum sp. LAM-1]